MNAYIASYGVISPQRTFDAKGFPDEISRDVSDRMTCLEPDYKLHINPIQLRRMPRILKMGLASAGICLERVNGVRPEAIVVGTGLGCLENLEKFLVEVLAKEEHVTSVLPFINSTHNAVASQIAMIHKNNGYNYTYCHRAMSFESALQDALLLLEEGEAKNVLAGGIDECTAHFMQLQDYLGRWKKTRRHADLFSESTPGTIAGEGSAFFLLSDVPNGNSRACLKSVRTRFAQASVADEINIFLSDNQLEKKDVDVVLMGLSGDHPSDSVYYDLMQTCFSTESTFAAFKHLCGEYYTASAFALWLGTVMLNEQHVPEVVRIGGEMQIQNGLRNDGAHLVPNEFRNEGGRPKAIEHILIYNHFRNTEHAFMLLSRSPSG